MAGIGVANNTAAGIELGSMPQLAEARNSEDDWTGTTIKAERRKRQNRLNQRAHRRRNATKAQQEQLIATDGKCVFRGWVSKANSHPVGCIDPPLPLLNEPPELYHSSHQSRSSPEPGVTPVTPTNNLKIAGQSINEMLNFGVFPTIPYSEATRYGGYSGQIETEINHDLEKFQTFQRRICEAFSNNLFAISRDHLLSIMHFNVYRAIMANVEALKLPPESVCSRKEPLRLHPSIVPPKWLSPTHVQLTVPHGGYLDVLPHPRLRDNLILNLARFTKDELCDDLMGEIFHHPDLRVPQDIFEWLMKRRKADGGALSVVRCGLIVWGDPVDVGSWEATPGFIKKWGWALKGCRELIVSSNFWRASRGEPAFVVEDIV